jgi:hypothetical protein
LFLPDYYVSANHHPIPKKAEEYHRSLNNAALSVSPARTVRTQTNYIFASMIVFFKLEVMKQKIKRTTAP